MRLEFFVPGDAKTSGSKRGFFNKKTGKTIFAPANPKQKDWQGAVKWFALQAANRMVPLDGPVILTCCFYRARPKGHYRTIAGRTSRLLKRGYENLRPDSKPDGLKLCRAVEDAMSKIIYTDDARVCEHHISKRYCDEGQVPGVQIIIETYEDRKDVDYGKEETSRHRTGSLFGSVGREGPDDGGHQPAHGGGAQRPDLVHSVVPERPGQ